MFCGHPAVAEIGRRTRLRFPAGDPSRTAPNAGRRRPVAAFLRPVIERTRDRPVHPSRHLVPREFRKYARPTCPRCERVTERHLLAECLARVVVPMADNAQTTADATGRVFEACRVPSIAAPRPNERRPMIVEALAPELSFVGAKQPTMLGDTWVYRCRSVIGRPGTVWWVLREGWPWCPDVRTRGEQFGMCTAVVRDRLAALGRWSRERAM